MFLPSDPQARRPAIRGHRGSYPIPINPASADPTGKRLVSLRIPRAADMCATSLRRHLIKTKIGTREADCEKVQAMEQKKMGRLPYDKQMELAYQIYEALCAQHPDWLVALSDTRAALQKRAAAALATRPSSDNEGSSTGDV